MGLSMLLSSTADHFHRSDCCPDGWFRLLPDLNFHLAAPCWNWKGNRPVTVRRSSISREVAV